MSEPMAWTLIFFAFAADSLLPITAIDLGTGQEITTWSEYMLADSCASSGLTPGIQGDTSDAGIVFVWLPSITSVPEAPDDEIDLPVNTGRCGLFISKD